MLFFCHWHALKLADPTPLSHPVVIGRATWARPCWHQRVSTPFGGTLSGRGRVTDVHVFHQYFVGGARVRWCGIKELFHGDGEAFFQQFCLTLESSIACCLPILVFIFIRVAILQDVCDGIWGWGLFERCLQSTAVTVFVWMNPLDCHGFTVFDLAEAKRLPTLRTQRRSGSANVSCFMLSCDASSAVGPCVPFY